MTIKRTSSEKKVSSVCPECHHTNVFVVDSRASHILGMESIRRRRRCGDCKFSFTTYEVDNGVVETLQLMSDFRDFLEKAYPALRKLLVRL